MRSEPDITIITVVGEVDVDQDCGLADGLCNLVAATLGDATAAEMNLRMHKGPGVEVGLAANIEVSGIRLARYDEPQGSDTYPCGDGSQVHSCNGFDISFGPHHIARFRHHPSPQCRAVWSTSSCPWLRC